MTDQELIAALRWNMMETGSIICLGCGHEHGCSTHGCAVLREAAERIERLGEQPQSNQPLTLDELRGMGGEPVYIKLLDVDEGFWALRSEWIDARAPEPIVLFHMRWYAHSDYGNTWLAYRHKPEEGTK